MHTILMAGGKGRRFLVDIEKPFLNISGRPIIEIILDSLIDLSLDNTIDKIIVCTTTYTPITERFVLRLASKREDLSIIRTSGKGYIEDLQECINYLSLREPFLYMSADIPLFDSEILRYIISIYKKVEKDALAVFMQKEVYDKYKIKTDLILEYNNENIVPTGINIIDGSYIDEEQEEYKLILGLKDIRKVPTLAYLAFNINYVENYIKFIKLYKQNSCKMGKLTK
ncbi:MAG: hypothetical protein EF806_03165 [Candidatus Methanoliparum thermophilum]|uniref:MobA-like NTP transferase domain-containing protein n=1 Tax=Methanoliparum thermophilum TaxID=2491083 RepID=A0A520KU30_METT2|nr:NTP transferase domain-containing protein [Candidatus Methanoliparum sp. LAM-1]RZN65055.1 MAG: hypothetical protein EF806_03165 [Candidatus Methanoliparum thermophilum]